jgi:hypothetical protein
LKLHKGPYPKEIQLNNKFQASAFQQQPPSPPTCARQAILPPPTFSRTSFLGGNVISTSHHNHFWKNQENQHQITESLIRSSPDLIG